MKEGGAEERLTTTRRFIWVFSNTENRMGGTLMDEMYYLVNRVAAHTNKVAPLKMGFCL
jgi:hypothetical protein